MKIIENRKILYTISLSAIILGLIFMVYNQFVTKQGTLNYGIEFKGGTVLTVDIGKEFLKTDVTELVQGVTNDKNAQVQEIIGENKVIIKLASESVSSDTSVSEETSEPEVIQEVVAAGEVSTTAENNNKEIINSVLAAATPESQMTELVFNALKQKYELEDASLIEMSNISPTVGSEMTQNAILSVLLAAIVILLYVSYRFKDTKMGIASILALLHDVLFVLAIYAIFRLPVGNSFIAAILTIVGYSINNTIVIFDRVRENNRGNVRLHKDILINRSVKETLTRTVNSSITTLLAIVALYFLGVDSIKEFTLPLIAGILIGTYSSVTIASSLWYDLVHFKRTKKAE